MVKNLPTMKEKRVSSLDWEDPLKKGMATHSSIYLENIFQYLPGKFHGQRSLAGYSPWGGKS